MAIPDKKEWNALKAAQKPKIPDKVSSVSIGSALDKYHAAFKKGGMLGAVRDIDALSKAIKTYKDDLKKKHPAFVKAFTSSIEDPVIKEIQQGQEMSHYPARMRTALTALDKSLAELNKTGDKKTYMRAAGEFQAFKSGLGEIIRLDKTNRDWADKMSTDISKSFDRDTDKATPDDYKKAAADTHATLGKAIAELKSKYLYS